MVCPNRGLYWSKMPNPLAEELWGDRHAQPCVLVIFGATGDLTHRKLVPALVNLQRDGLLPPGFSVVGFARRDKTHDGFRSELRASLEKFSGDRENLEAFDSLASGIYYECSAFEDPDGYVRLQKRLGEIDGEHGTRGNRIFYLATPPSAYSGILEKLQENSLSEERHSHFSRVIVEKPFGRDLETARSLNTQVAAAFEESQVFRIDHYLGKETVQNILAMRFANGIFEPLWSEKYIDHVQITVAESIGIEGRGGYFDHAGILRDMIQNHLLQVLSLIAMEPPISLEPDAVRDEKVKVLRAIRSLTPDKVVATTLRGQYGPGLVGGKEVGSYLDETGVASDSRTETYAAVKLRVDNWRWGRVPFFLRAGKRLPRRVTEVAIFFRPPSQLLFGQDLGANQLLIRIQPDEGISLRFGSKVPGPDMRLRDVRMDFRYGTSFGTPSADAYERLLLDAMVGDSTLFARRDEVEEAWRIVDSILAGWSGSDSVPAAYESGSWGPEHADAFLRKGRRWRKP